MNLYAAAVSAWDQNRIILIALNVLAQDEKTAEVDVRQHIREMYPFVGRIEVTLAQITPSDVARAARHYGLMK